MLSFYIQIESCTMKECSISVEKEEKRINNMSKVVSYKSPLRS